MPSLKTIGAPLTADLRHCPGRRPSRPLHTDSIGGVVSREEIGKVGRQWGRRFVGPDFQPGLICISEVELPLDELTGLDASLPVERDPTDDFLNECQAQIGIAIIRIRVGDVLLGVGETVAIRIIGRGKGEGTEILEFPRIRQAVVVGSCPPSWS